MDIDVSASIKINKCHGVCTYTHESTNATEDLSVNKLRNDVNESLNIDRYGVPDPRPPCEKYEFQKKEKAIEKFFGKCDILPSSSKTTCSAEASIESALNTNAILVQESTPRDDIKSFDPDDSCSPSLPTTLKPISAIKGTRAKYGAASPQKLTVKWAPDVYDPVPTSVSHSITNNRPQSHSKNSSKSKQKNRSKLPRGNKHKGKLAGKRGGG